MEKNNNFKPIINNDTNGNESLFKVTLIPILKGLNWLGDKVILKEAMPFDKTIFDINSVLSTMANLGYNSKIMETSIYEVSDSCVPGILIYNNNIFVLLKKDSKNAFVFNTQKKTISTNSA